MKIINKVSRIIISRTDNIGDVVLTLPIAGLLKERFPNCKIAFLGKKYTLPIISQCTHLDILIDYDEFSGLTDKEIINKYQLDTYDTIIHVFPNKRISRLAFKAKIVNRIGTSHRLFHWLYCNILIPLNRKNSQYHESQLNSLLLKPFKISIPNLEVIPNYYGFKKEHNVCEKVQSIINQSKRTIIIHPKSKGSAREWSLKKFQELIDVLHKKDYQIIITGTKEEGEKVFQTIRRDNVINTCGLLTLEELINLISQSEALVSASTGVLHIASAFGIKAIGIFVPKRPIHPGRWAPVGINAKVVVKAGKCFKCPNPSVCECMKAVSVKMVLEKILE